MDRSVYDIRDEENDAYRMEAGLTPEIVDKLSKEKDDPVWMQHFRLEALQIYNEMKIPDWGPSIEGLDMEHIATYVRPNTKMRNAGRMYRRISRRHLSGWVSRRRKESRSPVWVRSMIRSSSTTTSRILWQRRVWCTPTWRAP